MPVTIGAGEHLIEVQMVGRLHGQVTRTVYHWYANIVGPINDGLGFLEQVLSNQYFEDLNSQTLAGMSNEYSLTEWTAQWISPTRFRKVNRDGPSFAASVGQIQANSLPSSVAAVLSLYSDGSTRKDRGRHYYPAIPATREVDSRINDAALSWLSGIGGQLLTPFVQGTESFSLSIEPKAAFTAAAFLATDAQARDILRVQRRREIGVGE